MVADLSRMTFRRRSVPNRKAAIDAAIKTIATFEVGDAPSPEWSAVLLATDASAAASPEPTGTAWLKDCVMESCGPTILARYSNMRSRRILMVQ